MATLKKLFYQKNQDPARASLPSFQSEEIADILLQLVGSASRMITLSPENVELGEDHEIINLKDTTASLYYTAPEIIFKGASVSRETSLYSIGMLLYFMLYGRSYYEDKQLWMTSLPEMMQQRPSLITVSDETGIQAKYAEIMAIATSWDSKARFGAFQKIVKLVQEYQSNAEIIYLYKEKIVLTELLNVKDSSMKLPITRIIKGQDGQNYCLKDEILVFHRPGKHVYRVEVEPIASTPSENNTLFSTRSGSIRYHEQNAKIPLTICNYSSGKYEERTFTIRSGKQRIFIFEAKESGGDVREFGRLSIPSTGPNDSVYIQIICEGVHCKVSSWLKSPNYNEPVQLSNPPLEIDL